MRNFKVSDVSLNVKIGVEWRTSDASGESVPHLFLMNKENLVDFGNLYGDVEEHHVDVPWWDLPRQTHMVRINDIQWVRDLLHGVLF